VVLAGEWVTAWLAMSITFLVGLLGVTGLGWYVLHEEARNRASEDIDTAEPTEHH
jgi:hypothetical protein